MGLILQCKFMDIARRMYDDGLYAGAALERSTRWFADRNAEYESLVAAQRDFSYHFNQLMDLIREEVEGDRERGSKAEDAAYLKGFNDGRAYVEDGTASAVDRPAVHTSGAHHPVGADDTGTACAGSAALPCSGGEVFPSEVSEGVQAKRSELRSVSLDHTDHTDRVTFSRPSTADQIARARLRPRVGE